MSIVAPLTFVNAAASSPCSAAGTSLSDCSFETPGLQAGNWGSYAYNPSGTAWAFNGQSGVAANGSAFTYANPSAPDGTQVAFLQNGGWMAQSISGFDGGSYTLSFQAARRNYYDKQQIEVRLDSTVLGDVLVGQTSYTGYSVVFTPAAGTHQLVFAGMLGMGGGDVTGFVDDVSLSRTAPAQDCASAAGTTLSQCGFETPSLAAGTYTYTAFLGSAWTFNGQSGLTANGSGFTAANAGAPEGSQVVFLQNQGWISQQVGGFTASTDYTLTFQAARRANYGAQQVAVDLDGQTLAEVQLQDTAYATYTVTFTPSAGSHQLVFAGLGGGDVTAFVDDLQLFAKPAMKATSLQYTGDTQLRAGQPASLAAVLSDPAGQPVVGRTLQFELGGSQPCSAVTDGSGTAACTIGAVDQVAGLSDIPVSVGFAGDAQYFGSSANAEVTVYHTTSLAYTGASSANFDDPFTAAAVLTDVSYAPNAINGVPGMPVTFSLGGASCQAVTDGSGSAACSLTPRSPSGAWLLTAAVPTIGAWLGSTATAGFQVSREETALSFAPPATALSGSVPVSATLTEDGSAPIAGRSVTFAIGGLSCSATSNASGVASCAIDTSSLPLGPTAVTASFAGDGYYNAASASGLVLLYAFPSSGVFVIGDEADPNNINFYDSKWSQSNPMSGGPGPKNFKGFADAVTALAPGGTFSATPGGSVRPPQSVPTYMAVAVTSKVTDNNGVESGTIVRLGIVHVNVYVATVGGSGHGKLV